MKRILVVGAGFSGAVAARELVEKLPAEVVVWESRDHLGGNCHTVRDPATGVMLHQYGPHIFHTSDERVWEYVRRFGTFAPFVNRVKASIRAGLFSLPVNLHTINQFFGLRLNPVEAQEFIRSKADASIGEPQNFEEQALKMIGRELYEAFFLGYTQKQWGCHPRELPASLLKRLPVRFNYDDNYYIDPYQGIPKEGYTAIMANLLDHPRIRFELGRTFRRPDFVNSNFDHLIYTGPIDTYFGHCAGRLGYRTVDFERIDAEGDFQGTAVINYPGLQESFTRIHEHKHFAPWEQHSRTVAFREYSKETGEMDSPYYPKRLAGDLRLLAEYQELARAESRVGFLGRLGTYRYLDMEAVIREALQFCDGMIG